MAGRLSALWRPPKVIIGDYVAGVTSTQVLAPAVPRGRDEVHELMRAESNSCRRGPWPPVAQSGHRYQVRAPSPARLWCADRGNACGKRIADSWAEADREAGHKQPGTAGKSIRMYRYGAAGCWHPRKIRCDSMSASRAGTDRKWWLLRASPDAAGADC